MNANEKRLADALLPCPHCGKAPVVTVASHEDDESAKWLDVSFIRQIRLGRPYCCIECCTVLEGNEGWEEMAATWNRRVEPQAAGLKEGWEKAWELLQRWPEVRAKAFPELAEMDKSFNAAREKALESIERGPRRMSRAPDI